MKSLVETLNEMYELGLSLYAKSDYTQLSLEPPTRKKELLAALEEHFIDLRELLPGVCDGCESWTTKRTRTYWSEQYFCSRCFKVVMHQVKNHGWPQMISELPENCEAITDY